MAVIGRTGVHHPRRNNAPVTTIRMCGSLLRSCADTMDAVQPARRQAPLRQLTRSLVAVAAADVDPLQSIGRPDSAPATVVGGVGEGRADERKAVEAVMEAVTMEPVRESGMRKMRTRETAAAEMRCAHPADMHASAHAADVHAAGTHPSSHPAMHAIGGMGGGMHVGGMRDRKSTRLNSSHQIISYAVFCFKKKKRRLMY